MTNRWHNTPTADLIALEAQTRAEAYQIKEALRERLIAEAKEQITIGAVYRIAADGRPLSGRLLLVNGINAGVDNLPDLRGTNPWRVFAWGVLNGKSAAGDGWTIRSQNVTISRLTWERDKP